MIRRPGRLSRLITAATLCSLISGAHALTWTDIWNPSKEARDQACLQTQQYKAMPGHTPAEVDLARAAYQQLQLGRFVADYRGLSTLPDNAPPEAHYPVSLVFPLGMAVMRCEDAIDYGMPRPTLTTLPLAVYLYGQRSTFKGIGTWSVHLHFLDEAGQDFAQIDTTSFTVGPRVGWARSCKQDVCVWNGSNRYWFTLDKEYLPLLTKLHTLRVVYTRDSEKGQRDYQLSDFEVRELKDAP